MENIEYGKLIKEYREIEGITQIAFAKLLGVSDMTVARWESGRFEPSPEKKKELRNLFRERGLIKDIKFEPFKPNERMTGFMGAGTNLRSGVNEIDNYDRRRVNSVISSYINEYRDELTIDKYEGAKKICIELLKNFGQKYYEYFKVAFMEMTDISDEEFDDRMEIYDDGMYISCSGILIKPVDNFFGKTVTFPGYIHTIGEKAFMGCPFIERIVIEGNIEKIEDGAFNYCRSLNEIIFSEISPELEIGRECFDGCTKLKRIITDDVESLFFIKTKTYIFANGASLYYSNNGKEEAVYSLNVPEKGNLANFSGIGNIKELHICGDHSIKIDENLIGKE